MTNSRPLAATFRLSKLFRILAFAVFIKLMLVVSLFFDMPMHDSQAADAPKENAVLAARLKSSAVLQQKDAGAFAHSQPVAAPQTEKPDAAAPSHKFRASLRGGAAYAAEAEPENAAEQPAPEEDPMLREALQRKEADLDRREQELNALQKDIETKLNDLKDMEVRLQVMLKEADVQKDQKMRHLIDVYSNMKPKQAGQVLETLDERTAARILAGMRGRQAGEILTFVSPEKAAKLSEMLTRMQMPFE